MSNNLLRLVETKSKAHSGETTFVSKIRGRSGLKEPSKKGIEPNLWEDSPCYIKTLEVVPASLGPLKRNWKWALRRIRRNCHHLHLEQPSPFVVNETIKPATHFEAEGTATQKPLRPYQDWD